MGQQIAQTNCSTINSYLNHKAALFPIFKWPFHYYLISLFLVLNSISTVFADHTNPKIYDSLESSHFCFRRLNQTHQLGCASQAGGNYGIAKLIQSATQEEDLEYIANKGSNPPYVAIIDTNQFGNISLLQFLKSISTNRVSGLLVLDTGRPSDLSSDSFCPNEFSSLYVKSPKYGHCLNHQWNKPTPHHLEGMMFMDFPFPMFLLRNQSQIESLKKKINQRPLDSWPKLAVELLAPMHAAKDAVTCMRRSQMSGRFNLYSDILCDPLGGFNIFHHTLNLSSTAKIAQNSMVVLGARQDSFSMFDAVTPGADSALTSVIVLLAIAEMLNQEPIKKDILAADKSLLLALFDGEAYDYMGSSDTVYRMKENTFVAADPFRYIDQKKYPTINLTHLSHFIELSQLGQYNNKTNDKYQLFLHKNLQAPPHLQTLLKLIHDEAASHNLKNLTLTNIPDDNPLPPSSAHSFLKKRNDADFSVLVAANHEKEYINKFYNSFYEDGSDFSSNLAQQLTDVATLFGLTAYRVVTGKSMAPAYNKAKESTVKELLTCFTKDSNCKLFQQVQDPNVTPTTKGSRPPFSTYVSVYRQVKAIREYTRLLLFRFTGDKIDSANTSSECKTLANNNKDNQFDYVWQNGESMAGECIRSSAYMVNTASPSLDTSTTYMNEDLLKEYPFWVESKWQMTSLRIFVVPSPAQKWVISILGLLILALSFAVVIYLERHAVFFFGDHSRPKQNGTNSGLRNPEYTTRNARGDLPESEEPVNPNHG